MYIVGKFSSMLDGVEYAINIVGSKYIEGIYYFHGNISREKINTDDCLGDIFFRSYPGGIFYQSHIQSPYSINEMFIYLDEDEKPCIFPIPEKNKEEIIQFLINSPDLGKYPISQQDLSVMISFGAL